MANNGNGGALKPHALDLNSVWARGFTLMQDNFQLIAIIGGIFILLPSAALQFALPADTELDAPLGAVFDPDIGEAARQEALAALSQLIAPFFILSVAATIVAHLGYAAITALIGRARPTVGEALIQAGKAILPLIAAMLIVLIGYWIAIIAMQAFLALFGPPGAVLGAIIAVVFVLFLSARLYLTLAVITLENEFNPFTALLRSWQLTSANAGQVFLFWSSLGVMWFVTLFLQAAVSLAFTALVGPGSTAILIEGLLSGGFAMVWGAIYCAMGVSLHALLAGPHVEDITADFE